MNIHEFFNEWGGVVGAIVGVLGAALGGYYGSIKKTNGPKERRPFMLTVAASTYVGLVVFLGLLFGLGFALRTEPGTEFQRTGVPALKLEVRRASIEKVEGWKSTTIKDPSDGTYYVSPEVQLSNDDVASTGVHFEPFLPKAVSRWKGWALFLVFSIVSFVAWRRSKQSWWGVSGEKPKGGHPTFGDNLRKLAVPLSPLFLIISMASAPRVG